MSFAVTLAAEKLEVGQTVRGTVVFDEPQEKFARANGVRLEVFAEVSGSGTGEKVEVFNQLISEGAVRSPSQLGFEVALPVNGPCSFEGRYVKILWKVKASVDVDWAIDPKSVAVFRLVPKSAAR